MGISKENFDPIYNGMKGYFTLFGAIFLLKPLKADSYCALSRVYLRFLFCLITKCKHFATTYMK